MSVIRVSPMKTLDQYIDEKIAILCDEFLLKMSTEEVEHFYSLNSVAAVDNYALKLIMDKL